MKERKTSRDIKNEQTRQLILDTANRLFKERRYEDVTIKDICEACHVSVGAFYHHFGSKEHLVELFYIEFDGYIGRFVEEFDRLPPLDALYCLIGHEMDYLSTDITYPSQICVMQLLSGGDAFNRENRGYYQCLDAIVHRIFDCMSVKGMTEDEFRSSILRYTRGVLYDWCLHNGVYSLKAQALQDIKLMMAGLSANGKLQSKQ